MYQKLIVAGFLGRDPEMRYLPDGTAVTNFSMASTRRFTTGEGESNEETTWFHVETWRRQAETCNQYLAKGSPVLVEGRLKPDKNSGGPRTYQRQDGSVGASYELVAETVRFLGHSSGNSHNSQSEDDTPAADPVEDIPF